MSAKTIWFAVALAALLAPTWAAPRKQNVNEDKAFQEMFTGHPLLRSLKLFTYQHPTKETTEKNEKDNIHIITLPAYQPQPQHPAPPHHYYPPPQHHHTPPPAHHNPPPSYHQPPSYHHPPPPSYHPSPPSSHQPPPAGIPIPPYLWSQLANSGYPIIIINTTSIGAANIVEQAPADTGTTRSIYGFNVPPPSVLASEPALVPVKAEAEPVDYIAVQPSQDADMAEDVEYDEEDIEEPKFAAVLPNKGTKIVGHSKNPILEAILARDRRRKRVRERGAAVFYLRNYNENRK